MENKDFNFLNKFVKLVQKIVHIRVCTNFLETVCKIVKAIILLYNKCNI